MNEMKGQKTVANLGKNGISTVWVYVLCIYLALISMIPVIIAEGWAENLSILGTIPEALLWYWICRRLFSEQKMEKDMYILIVISYGLMVLSDIFSFLEETETAESISALIGLVTGIISMIMMWIRYDGAMKKYAIWSIICGVGLIVALLIFGDPAEMGFIGLDRVVKGLFVVLLSLPYLLLIDVLREDEEETPDENEIAQVLVNETTVEPKEESSAVEKTIREEAVVQKKAAVKIIVLVISAIIIIASALYCVRLLNEDSDTGAEYGSTFMELEENPTPTHYDNYYFGTIVVSANKDSYTNIREKPSTTSTIVGILYDGVKSEQGINGEVCEVWENFAKLYGREGNWLQVGTNDTEGYVHISQVKVIENGIAVEK